MLNKHYNKRYFKWQSQIGEFGGKANLIKFNNLFKPGQKILDFGCGSSYMLKNIKEKNTKLFGIEVNKETKILQKLMKLRFFK